MKRSLITFVVLALIGAVFGTVGDQIHTQFHVLHYPHGERWLCGQALWVPFLFAGATLVFVYGYQITILFTGDREYVARATVWQPFVWHFAAYFSTGFFFQSPRALTLGLTAAWLVRVALNRRAGFIVHSLGAAVGGPAFEFALSGTGAFIYARPDFVIPMWLPALYLHVAPLARHVYLAWVISSPPASPATSSTAT